MLKPLSLSKVFLCVIIFYVVSFSTPALSASHQNNSIIKPNSDVNTFSYSTELQFAKIAEHHPDAPKQITALIEDKQGFIWIGTPHGLVRYDGYDFKWYNKVSFIQEKNNQVNDYDISSFYVRSLAIGNDGHIWLGTMYSGLLRLNPNTDQFKQYKVTDNKKTSLSENRIEAIVVTTSAVWVGTTNGLDHIELATDIVSHFKHDAENTASLPDNNVRSLLLDDNNILWVGTWDGLSQLNLNELSLSSQSLSSDIFKRVYSEPRVKNSLAGQNIYRLFQDSHQNIWIGTGRNGLAWIEHSTGEFKRLPYSAVLKVNTTPEWIMSFAQPSKNEIWFGGSSNSLVIIDIPSGEIKKNVSAEKYAHALNSNQISAMLLDSSGSVWLGHWSNGLNRYHHQRNNFQLITANNLKVPEGIALDVVNMLQLQANTVYQGDIILGLHDDGLVHLKRNTTINEQLQFRYHKQLLADERIRVMSESPDGSIWIATEVHGLYHFSAEMVLLKHFNQASTFSGLNSIFFTEKGVLLLGGGSGIFQLCENNTLLCPVFFGNNGKNNTASIQESNGALSNFEGNITTIKQTPDGVFWLGSRSGLFYAENLKTPMIKVGLSTKDNLLDSYQVNDLLLDKQSRLWIASSKGVHLLSKFLHGKSEFISVDDLIFEEDATDIIYSLKEDDQGRIWGGGRIYNLVDREAYFLDDLEVGEHVTWGGLKLEQGDFWQGLKGGILAMKPDTFTPWQYQPPVVTTSVTVNSKVSHIVQGNELILPPNTKNINVSFSALDYSLPEKNEYAYKLEGFDDDWRETDYKNRHATYTNLAPGEYNLRVKGTNRKGVWSSRHLNIAIVQLPAWYQNLWFKLLIALMLISCLYALYLYRVRKIIWERQQLELAVEQRTTELKDAQKTIVMQEKMSSLGTLSAGIAHEINNPTTFVYGSVQNMEVDLTEFKTFLFNLVGDDADQAVLDTFEERFNPLFMHLDIISEGAQRIKKIVTGLRVFARGDNDEMESTSIQQCIETTVELVNTEYKDITEFCLNFTDSPNILCFPSKINQVLMNLLVNASQAIKEHTLIEIEKAKIEGSRSHFFGKITITTKATDEHCVIKITDNGHGIDEEDIHKVFEPFFTTKVVGSGTGLGLAICYEIVQQHNGKLSVKSEQGVGTSFVLKIPLGQDV